MASFLSIPPIGTDSDQGSVPYRRVTSTWLVVESQFYVAARGMTAISP